MSNYVKERDREFTCWYERGSLGVTQRETIIMGNIFEREREVRSL